MTVQIDTTAENNGVRLVKQGTHPSAPSAGHVILYYVTGTSSPGLFIEDVNGARIGPFITGSSGGGSGLAFLETHTASNSATLDFTNLSSTYDEYLLIVSNFIPATNAADLWLRVGTGAGPTYQTASYEYQTENYYANGGVAPAPGSASASDSKIIIWQSNDSGVARGNSFDIRIRDALNASLEKAFSWQGNGVLSSANTRRYKIDGVGTWDANTVLTGLRLMYSTGNIASGGARLYGYVKS
jgi:hypothetical protein